MKRLAVLLLPVVTMLSCSDSADSVEAVPAAGSGSEDPPAPPDTCGDGVCSAEDAEYCETCPADCGPCGTCGDGKCEPGVEQCEDCPQDCGACGVCGDGECTEAEAEDCSTCASDCGACLGCGDTVCDATASETCSSCPGDCGPCDSCGNGDCDADESETCSTCAKDCGACDPCGDGECDPDANENCTTCAKDCAESCDVREGCVQGSFKAYWGNLHAHTSYSDGELTPAAAFDHAKGAKLDFMWITDHKGQMSQNQWDHCRTMANAANTDGEFVAGCGYEIVILTDGGGQLGHFNFLFVSKMIPAPKGLGALYDAVENCSPCLGQWNHPPNPANFHDYEYHPVAKDRMRLIEFNGAGTWGVKQGEYLEALRKKWLVSPSFNEDNHHQNWGDSHHATGLFANELSRLGLRKAIAGRRTFATLDDTASIRMKADDVCWMGSVLQGFGSTELTVVARDKQAGDGFKRIVLLGPNGNEVASHGCNDETPCTAKFNRQINQATHFVAMAIQTDGDRVISAPIWYEK